MRRLIKIYLLCSLSAVCFSQTQQRQLDSLYMSWKAAPNDTLKMSAVYDLAGYYAESNRDSCLFFAEQGLMLSKELNQPLWTGFFLLVKAYAVMHKGNLPLAFKLTNEAMAIAKDKKSEKNAYISKADEFAGAPSKFRLVLLSASLHHLGNLYGSAGNKEKAINCFQEEIQISELLHTKSGLITSNMNIGSIYLGLDKLDSAYLYSTRALNNSIITKLLTYQGSILENIGTIHFKKKQLDSARHYYWQSAQISKEQNNLSNEASIYIMLAKYYESMLHVDSMMFYARAALNIATGLKSPIRISTSTALLSAAYKLQGNTDSAFAYLAISKKLADSLNTDRNEKLMQFQNINFDEQMRLEKIEKENIAYKNKMRIAALFAGVGLLSILAFVFYRNTRQKQKANKVLEYTLDNLKSTQSQLIQSEKMASLGELTAGIAHEIQNPLNFVNNFSEVSVELIRELVDEADKGNTGEVKEIANDLVQNLEKINHHGKRADAIVKGMLQHSRSSSGQKEPTDINALADEYLRLAYHGLRAKDKSFNATLKTDYDDKIGKINVIPQDLGRVILNLITNAFYAVGERKKKDNADYVATVTVSTHSSLLRRGVGGEVIISVKDNGAGIPQKVLDKIFQPFFTTKPTGQGTGLGLSLAYDIVKVHGGELKVETKEGQGTTFIIQLPIV